MVVHDLTARAAAARMLQACGRWLCGASIALVLVAGHAAAADDWLDDMPSVPTVVDVVRQSVDQQIRQYPQIAADPDFLPMRLIGTFVLLRWVMEFQIETQGSLSPERMKRMHGIANDYMQAEFAIGLGTARRNGMVKNQCQKDGPNRADFKQFPSAEACHRYVTQKIISNVYASFNWRNEIFPRIFCDRAKVYLELMQKNILTLPAPTRSPAVVGQMPDGTAMLGMRFCDAYGGDANGNGLCEDWEKRLGDRDATAVAALTCGPIIMDKVRMAPGKGLAVTLAKNSGKLGATASFRVSRSSQPKIDADAQQVWAGDAQIQSGTTSEAPMQVVLAQDAKLTPDQSRPYLLVEVTSGAAAAPVHCEQPIKNEDGRNRVPRSNGLHGGYDSIDDAMLRDDVTLIALQLMGAGFNTAETGFLVIRDARVRPGGKGAYYTTPALRSSSEPTVGRPTFLAVDYGRSFGDAFRTSCENIEDFGVVSIVHTHPDKSDVVEDNFSIPDFEILFDYRARGAALEKMFMISARDCRVRMFTPLPSDRTVDGVIDALNPYLERVKILPIGLSPIPPLCRS